MKLADATAIIASKTETSFSGPMPDPQTLAQYEAILPGTANRIFTMAENQAAHRQMLEKTVVTSGVRDSLLGIVSGFVISAITIISGTIVILNGHDWPGAILGTSGIAGLAGVFVYGTRAGRKERESKEKELINN